ncbi:MAG TPA: hypothetical protein DEO38_02000 [Bacteroidales bacterium]|nr:hypothetical protein [Bacteroidales bacterium]
MKRFLTIFIALAALVFSGCKDKDDPKKSGAEIKLSIDYKTIQSGTFSVIIECDAAWKASSEASWITLSPESGEGGNVVLVTVEAGTQEQAEVIFTSGAYTATLTIVRKADTSLDTYLSATPIFIQGQGGKYDITVNSSSSWTATSNMDFVTLSPKSGSKGKSTMKVDVSTSTKFGSGQITIQNSTHKVSIQIVRNPSQATPDPQQPEQEVVPTSPQGTLWAAYSVGNNKKIRFSKGNLQYNPAQKKWKFADNQYDIIGASNGNISATYNGWIDLFGWGTSGFSLQPTETSKTSKDYRYNGQSDISDSYRDWGVYCAISNGGNKANLWRTMTRSEWRYVVGVTKDCDGNVIAAPHRTNAENLRGLATVNGRKGFILLPDDYYKAPATVNFTPNGSSYNDNIYTVEQWKLMQDKGVVFFPCSAYREGKKVTDVGTYPEYWLATFYDMWEGWGGSGDRYFAMVTLVTEKGYSEMFNFINVGLPVRLIQDYQ